MPWSERGAVEGPVDSWTRRVARASRAARNLPLNPTPYLPVSPDALLRVRCGGSCPSPQTAVPPLPPTRHLVCFFQPQPPLRLIPAATPPPVGTRTRNNRPIRDPSPQNAPYPYPAYSPSVSKLGPPAPTTPCFRLGAREEKRRGGVGGAYGGDSLPPSFPHTSISKGSPGGPHGVRGHGGRRIPANPGLSDGGGRIFLGWPRFPQVARQVGRSVREGGEEGALGMWARLVGVSAWCTRLSCWGKSTG